MEDLSYGTDIRGDYALFIEAKHFIGNGWELDAQTKEQLRGCNPTFFRAISKGKQLQSHGWIEDGEIVQWG